MTTWINQEGIMLSEISQTKKDNNNTAQYVCMSTDNRMVVARGWRMGESGRGWQICINLQLIR